MKKDDEMDLKSAVHIVADFGKSRKENDDETIARMLKGKDISEVVNLMFCSGNTYNRRILRFFRGFCKWVPVTVMVAHWYGLYDFSKHPRDMFVLDSANLPCYLWIYFMVYILPMVIILASRFFFLCWRYRIPFFYFFGVNALHICYGNIFTTNEMVMPHVCLIAMICMLYVYGFGEMLLNTKVGRRLI